MLCILWYTLSRLYAKSLDDEYTYRPGPCECIGVRDHILQRPPADDSILSTSQNRWSYYWVMRTYEARLCVYR
jgi:hypothetical protein